MSLTLYLLRHGQTELSREDNFCGAGLDPELTLWLAKKYNPYDYMARSALSLVC